MATSKLLVLVCLAICAGTGTALQCFVCNSQIDASCDDQQVPEKYLVTCDPLNAKAIEHPTLRTKLAPGVTSRTIPFAPEGTNYTYCRKVKLNIPVQNNGDTLTLASSRVERSCGYMDKEASNGCKWQPSSGGIQMLTCQCEGDRCNSAGFWKASVLILAALQITLFVRNNFV